MLGNKVKACLPSFGRLIIQDHYLLRHQKKWGALMSSVTRDVSEDYFASCLIEETMWI